MMMTATVTSQPGFVITSQPGIVVPAQWMQLPATQPFVNCPPGLEYLSAIDQLLCHQKVELLEAITGWETNNKYVIMNSLGQQIYYAFEDTDVCMRMFCGKQRAFTIHIVNNINQEVIRIRRDFKCCAGCCWCADCCAGCAQDLIVESPPGTAIGYVRQTSAACVYKYDIGDSMSNRAQLRIEGPCLMCRCCSDVEFPVYTSDGLTRVGCVTKQWSGLAREMFTDADHFGIKFPIDLDVKLKATLIGALFLIDFMAFENNQQKNN